MRFFGFFDIGTAAIHDALPEQVRSFSLSSTGVGVRIQLLDYFYDELADAITLDRGPNTKSGTDRVLFRFYGEF